ncbi:hypothetical protein B4080_6350 [Bacillus cereus]|nr:hypothetical protein B4080_6350 [Bacillus cereus]
MVKIYCVHHHFVLLYNKFNLLRFKNHTTKEGLGLESLFSPTP